ncbi:hypothetical protein OCK74_19260 [Chitinophagaceae bacterium LB-8]|uniref:Uncharacterized protein n=1 Tax=Paraflavisolibacter caeni TaxID=2982496 RepID=A0A9X2XXE9_9BACT|nr:hypothetical protein [Paraflavisolibacter caeni]MCU7551269.1 hypothetical protein [Paraflavisolibacter caeni]
MRPQSTYKLLLASFLVCLAITCLFVLNKQLYASGKEACCKEEPEVKSELPWESMTFQFVGSVLFK